MAARDHIEDNRQAGHLLPHWLTIGFSGHRKLANEQTLRDGLRQAFEHPAVHDRRLATVSSAACGADTVFLEDTKARGIPQFVILPFDRDSFRKDFSDKQWMRVEPLITTAIATCSSVPTSGLFQRAPLVGRLGCVLCSMLPMKAREIEILRHRVMPRRLLLLGEVARETFHRIRRLVQLATYQLLMKFLPGDIPIFGVEQRVGHLSSQER